MLYLGEAGKQWEAKLEEYRYAAVLINTYEKQIERIKRRFQWDVVLDGRNGYPRPSQVLSETIPSQDVNAARKRIENKTKAIIELESGLAEVEAFVESIQDPIIKNILILYYLEGKTWQEVSNCVYGRGTSEATARSAAKRFFQDF